ncbi:MAG: ABC transporter permease [Phycisphaerales bacterium]|nr:ABC transporter permease [Phycisphaerales bacterium]
MNARALTIARNTFIECLRQPVLLLLVLGCGTLQVLITWMSAFSMADVESAEVAGDNKILLDIGLSTVFLCGTLIAGFMATSAISREIENKTILTVVSKPIGRWIVVFGKFLGVAGAILIATVIMLTFLLFAIRHGVMSTSADGVDRPAVLFGLSAVFLSLIAGAWCNFFYRWNFPQVATLLLLPLIIIAYIAVLFVSKEWKIQPPLKDFKPQILLACSCLTIAILVLTSVAIAASTRLGQVMTIVMCMGVFTLSLMSNFFIGRHVFQNVHVAEVAAVEAPDPAKKELKLPGETLKIKLRNQPTKPIKVGASFYYSPSPVGFPMMLPAFPTHDGNFEKDGAILGPNVPPGVYVTAVNGTDLTIRHIGNAPLKILSAPQPDDFVFLEPTSINPLALTVWGVIPNMQSFWLLDAVSQNRSIPTIYPLYAAAYGLAQIAMFLALAVLLFEGRDVG